MPALPEEPSTAAAFADLTAFAAGVHEVRIPERIRPCQNAVQPMAFEGV